jgi:transcriptional regulator with XRE-family HTH domain
VPPPLPRERRALANAVRELRARRRITQEALAEAAGLGSNYISEVETGRKRVGYETVVLIAYGLGLPLSELVRLYEERLAEEPPPAASRPAARPAASSAP